LSFSGRIGIIGPTRVFWCATDRTATGLIRFPVGLSEQQKVRSTARVFERLQRNAWCSALVVAVS